MRAVTARAPALLKGDCCAPADLLQIRVHICCGEGAISSLYMQVSSNKVSRAENASLRSELGGLRSQLSEASKQLEAERTTSACLHLETNHRCFSVQLTVHSAP